MKLLTLYRIPLLAAAILQIFTFASAQDLDVLIRVGVDGKAAVTGRILPGSSITNRRNLGFLRSVTGDAKLAGRMKDVAVDDAAGKNLLIRTLIEGEYLAESDFSSFSYVVDLSTGQNPSALAHRSWLTGSRGILMLDDVLPQFGTVEKPIATKLTLALPDGWSVSNGKTAFTVPVTRDAVIYIGNDVRSRTAGGLEITFGGSWIFTDDEAAEMAKEIFNEYVRLFGAIPNHRPVLGLWRFPGEVSPGTWQAETRGGTVTIMSSDMPFRTQSLQRLHEQLRHEIFHLWVPNSVNLSGNYAWFYEGFALYQSLKAGVQLNRIRFEDMIDTLSRAHAIDARQSPRRPLVGDASGAAIVGDTNVYARGMLIAFLLDVDLMSESKGKMTIADVVRDIFTRHGQKSPRTDATTAILSSISRPGITKYVTGSDVIDWSTALAAAGLEAGEATRSGLVVSRKLTGKQKDILDKLGYNNWRRTPIRSK